MAHTIAIVNQKGGVGKTTTTINLAAALAGLGQRVLLVDLDPQGNASTGLGLLRAQREASVYDVLVDGRDADAAISTTSVPNLSLLPSDIDLSSAELEIGTQAGRTTRLREALSPLDSRFDYVLLDCPPSLNILTVNALSAAQSVLVPLQCEFFALEGLSQLLSTVDRVRDSINPALRIQGIVMTMFDGRNNLAAQVVADVRSTLGSQVYETLIPRNVRVSEAPSYGKPAILYDLKCAGSQAYLQLASEVIRRERRHDGATGREAA